MFTIFGGFSLGSNTRLFVSCQKKLKVSVGFKFVDKSTLVWRLDQNIENKNLLLKFISDSQFHLLICFLNCIIIFNFSCHLPHKLINFCHSVLFYRNPFIDFEMWSKIKPHNKELRLIYPPTTIPVCFHRFIQCSVWFEIITSYCAVIWLSTKSIPKWWKSALGSKEHLWYG